jgi:hypothetical protein
MTDDERAHEHEPAQEPVGPGTTAGGGEVRAGRRVDPDEGQGPKPPQEGVEQTEART